ncbi:MAG TPA: cytochrome c3 family protein [Anaeromyxobacteraceae bacterium]|nr:cytochrome c3 family protein [Anaeromyxobacteraceae bacterium]
MRRGASIAALALIAAAPLATLAQRAPPAGVPDREPTAAAAPNPLAPRDGPVASSHGPYVSGDCAVCHAEDGKRVGPARKPVNDVCLECHGEFGRAADAKGMRHPAPTRACTACHNPHNSPKKSLLL